MYNQPWGGAYDFNNAVGPQMWAHNVLPLWIAILAPWLIIFVLWSLFWKGLALWHSAQRGQYWWFVILLVVNTLGILEIVYYFFVAKSDVKQGVE